jgi:predicted acyltransferase
VLTAGLATVGLAVWISVVDVRHLGRWFTPLQVLGLNSVAAYLLSRPVTNVLKVHVQGMSLHADVLSRLASAPTASMLFAAMALLGVYCLVWLMHRNGWYLKF